MVLPAPLGPTSATRSPGVEPQADAVEGGIGLARVAGAHVLERDA